MDTYNIWNKKLRIYETTIDINSTKAVFAAWWPQGGRRILLFSPNFLFLRGLQAASRPEGSSRV